MSFLSDLLFIAGLSYSSNLPYNPAKVGLELKRIKVKLRQPSQREDQRTPTCHSLPQFKHIGHSDWANLRKSSLARIRLLPDYTVLCSSMLSLDGWTGGWALARIHLIPGRLCGW